MTTKFAVLIKVFFFGGGNKKKGPLALHLSEILFFAFTFKRALDWGGES